MIRSPIFFIPKSQQKWWLYCLIDLPTTDSICGGSRTIPLEAIPLSPLSPLVAGLCQLTHRPLTKWPETNDSSHRVYPMKYPDSFGYIISSNWIVWSFTHILKSVVTGIGTIIVQFILCIIVTSMISEKKTNIQYTSYHTHHYISVAVQVSRAWKICIKLTFTKPQQAQLSKECLHNP